MNNIDVATTETTVLTPDENRAWIILQNQSDTDMRIKFDGSSEELTSSNGYILRAGSTFVMSNDFLAQHMVNNGVSAVHGGSGAKVLHVQKGREIAP